MKTIRKVIALSVATLITGSVFGQLNLGIQSSTNAAVNAAAASSSALQATQAVTNATRSTVSATVAHTMDLKSATVHTTNATVGKSVEVAGKVQSGVSNNADIKLRKEISSNATINGQSQSAVGAGNGEAAVSVNGKGLLNASGESVSTLGAELGTQASGTLNATKKAAVGLQAETSSNINSIKRSSNVSAEVKSENKVTVGGQ